MSVKMKFGSKDIPFVYKGDKLVYPNPIKDGLLLWYDFKGMRNTDTNKEVAKDLSGNGNDGTLTNFNFTEESGYKDNTLVFDGVDDSLTIPEVALDETAMSVVQDGKVYSYEDDKVLAIKDYSDKELTYLESLRAEGRNLIRGSEFKEQTSHYTYQRVDTEFSEGTLRATNHLGTSTTYPRILYRPLGDLEVGQQYTISFKAKSGGKPFSADFWVSAASGGSRQITPQRPHYTEQWEKYEYTLTITGNFSDATCIQWWVNATNPDTFQTLYLKEIKLEKGITATDWSPAPEDVRENLPGLEAGGRNLILDSSNIQSRSMQVGVTTEKVTDMGYTNVLKINNPDLKSYFTISKDSYAEYPIANKDFTLSFLVRGIADENSAKTLTAYYNGSTMYTPMKGEIKEDEYSWVSVTFNTDDNAPSNHIGVSSFKELYFAKMKVSVGSEATEWSPAPEDFQTTSLSPLSLSNLQVYNRSLRKNELLHNAESKGLKELVDGVVVQDGLMIHYDFSHESNASEYKDKAFDYSGNGNHGELQNFNYSDESGYAEDGLKFDGIDDRVLMVSPGVESKAFLSSEMTIVWSGTIRETQPKSGINQILSAGYVSGWALGYHGQVDSLMYTVRDSNNSNGYHIRYLHRPPFGEFFTFAMTFKKGEVVVYLNGIERNKTVDTGDIIYSTYPTVEITRQAHQTTASCKIYNRVLTPEEIAHNYTIEKEKFDITEGDI